MGSQEVHDHSPNSNLTTSTVVTYKPYAYFVRMRAQAFSIRSCQVWGRPSSLCHGFTGQHACGCHRLVDYWRLGPCALRCGRSSLRSNVTMGRCNGCNRSLHWGYGDLVFSPRLVWKRYFEQGTAPNRKFRCSVGHPDNVETTRRLQDT